MKGTVTNFEHNPALHELEEQLTNEEKSRFKVFILDLKDIQLMKKAFDGSDTVIHIIDQY